MKATRGVCAFILLISGSASADDAPAVHQGRLRGGVDIFGGIGVSAGIKGPVTGAAVRAGWQLDDRFALYAQGELFGWIGTVAAGGDTAKNGLGGRLIAMGSYSPFDSVELGFGPSLDGATNLSTSSVAIVQYRGHSVPVSYGGTYFGFHEHVGLRLPLDHDRARRTGPSLVFDVHSTVSEPLDQLRVATTFTVGIGYEWF